MSLWENCDGQIKRIMPEFKGSEIPFEIQSFSSRETALKKSKLRASCESVSIKPAIFYLLENSIYSIFPKVLIQLTAEGKS